MAAEKPKEERVDQIFKRLGQIEAALCDLHLAVGNLRKERTNLWAEYHEILAAEIRGESETSAATG